MRTYNFKMSLVFGIWLLLLAGCQTFPNNIKSFLGANMSASGSVDKAAPVTAASSTVKAIDKIDELNKKTEQVKQSLDAQYSKFREQLADAYKARDQIDDTNFAQISEINYGIFKSTEDVTHMDTRVLIANLKAKENMARLLPITDERRKAIEDDIELDRKKTEQAIAQKYEAKIKLGEAAAAAYEKADQEVKTKEAEKVKLRSEQQEILAQLKANQDSEKIQLQKQAVSAVSVAKEQQKSEMLGWLVKSLGGIGIVVLLVGLLLRSPSFILSGVALLGLAYIAATIPFWVVATLMGVLILVMVMIDPKTGEFHVSHPYTSYTPNNPITNIVPSQPQANIIATTQATTPVQTNQPPTS